MRSHACAALAAAALSLGCTDYDRVGAPGTQGGPLDAPYGALEPRLAALDAMGGRRAPVTLRMTRTTVEGVPIRFELVVTPGLAVLSVDERADGGGVRVDSLPTLVLVRFVPGQFVGGVEVRKERLEPTDPGAARAMPGTYVLVEPRCVTGDCTAVF